MDERYLKDARVSRFAGLCCNAGLFCGIILLFLGLMPVIRLFYYLIILVFAAAVITAWLMSLLLLHPFDISFLQQSLFDSSGAAFGYIQKYTFKCAPYLCAVAIVLGVIAIVLTLRDKSVYKKGRIVAASLAIGFAAVGVIAVYAGGALI